LGIFVIGLTNDVKHCCERSSSAPAGDYPRDVTTLVDYAESVFGQWSRKLQAPLVYVGAAASYRLNPQDPLPEVRLDNIDAGGRVREHARAMARIYQKVEGLGGRGGAYSSFQANRVYFAQKPMTDYQRCDEKGHPHLTELYLQGCLMYNTIVFALQKGGVFSNLKCE
jgi:hypothetical protein